MTTEPTGVPSDRPIEHVREFFAEPDHPSYGLAAFNLRKLREPFEAGWTARRGTKDVELEELLLHSDCGIRIAAAVELSERRSCPLAVVPLLDAVLTVIAERGYADNDLDWAETSLEALRDYGSLAFLAEHRIWPYLYAHDDYAVRCAAACAALALAEVSEASQTVVALATRWQPAPLRAFIRGRLARMLKDGLVKRDGALNALVPVDGEETSNLRWYDDPPIVRVNQQVRDRVLEATLMVPDLVKLAQPERQLLDRAIAALERLPEPTPGLWIEYGVSARGESGSGYYDVAISDQHFAVRSGGSVNPGWGSDSFSGYRYEASEKGDHQDGMIGEWCSGFVCLLSTATFSISDRSDELSPGGDA
jgi:hypothetical protein